MSTSLTPVPSETKKAFPIDLDALTGSFEAHIIIEQTSTSVFDLFEFCASFTGNKDNKDIRTCVRPTCAQSSYGDYPIQPMMTYFTSQTGQKAIEVAKVTARTMQTRGFNVLRSKVEALSIPMDIQLAPLPEPLYYEFHFKVKRELASDWAKIDKICRPFGAALFFNPFTQKRERFQPLVTIRRYGMTMKDAMKDVTDLRKKLADAKVECDSKIHTELPLWDSNPDLDNNWIFTDHDPTKFITIFAE